MKTHVQGDKKRAANNIFGQAPPPVQPRTIRRATKNVKKLMHFEYWTAKTVVKVGKTTRKGQQTHVKYELRANDNEKKTRKSRGKQPATGNKST